MTLPSRAELLDYKHQEAALQFARQILLDAIGSRPSLDSKPRRAIVLVVGNGVVHLPFRRRDRLRAYLEGRARRTPCGALTSVQERGLVWRYNEALRDYSGSRLPPQALIYLAHLVLERLCSLILTPNYDLFIDSILAKVGRRVGLTHALNPRGSAVGRHHDGYGRDATSADISLLKYHGDVAHVVFERCEEVFKLPAFPVLPFFPLERGLRPIFESPVGGRSLAEGGMLHSYQGNRHPTGWPDHYIDFNFPNTPRRHLFGREIEVAVGAIESLEVAATAGFLIVGFAGRWVRDGDLISEEIVPPLVRKMQEGVPATMIFNPSDLDIRRSVLARSIYELNPGQLWLGDARDRLFQLLDSIDELKPGLSLDRNWTREALFA